MGNVKMVRAKGIAPFTIGENEDANRYLGYLNHPSVDLRLKWENTVKEWRKNEYGGETAYYEFTIEGIDGRRAEFFSDIVRVFTLSGATFYYFQWADMQNAPKHFYDHLRLMQEGTY